MEGFVIQSFYPESDKDRFTSNREMSITFNHTIQYFDLSLIRIEPALPVCRVSSSYNQIRIYAETKVNEDVNAKVFISHEIRDCYGQPLEFDTEW